MAKQKRVEEPANIQLNPTASPVSTFVRPGNQAPAAPTAMPGPAPPPSGPNANQQLASALTRYGDQLASFSPRLDVLQKGLQEAFNPIIEQRNEQAAAAGEAMVMNSQKTMAQLVADGEIGPEDNPWFIYGARKASGYLAAGAWERHVNIKYNEMITKDPAMTELQWDQAYRDMQAEFVSTRGMTDPFEMQVFHSMSRASKQRTDAKIVQAAHEHRMYLTNEAVNTSYGFARTAAGDREDSFREDVSAMSLGDDLQVNPEAEMSINGFTLEPEESLAAQLVMRNHVDRLMVDLESTLELEAETIGMTRAVANMRDRIIKDLSNPETYSRALELAYKNLEGGSGAKLFNSQAWQAAWSDARDVIEIASQTETQRDLLNIGEVMRSHPDMTEDEFVNWYSYSVSNHPEAINRARNSYSALRAQHNNWTDKLSHEDNQDLHNYFYTNKPHSYEDYLSSGLIENIAGDNPVLASEMRKRSFFDRWGGQYWKGSLKTSQKIEIYRLQEQYRDQILRGGPIPTAEDISRDLVGLELAVDTDLHNTNLGSIIRVLGSVRPPVDSIETEEYLNIRDGIRAFNDMGIRLTERDILLNIRGADRDEKIKDTATERALVREMLSFQDGLYPTPTEVSRIHEDMVQENASTLATTMATQGGTYDEYYKVISQTYNDGYSNNGQRFEATEEDGKITLKGGNQDITIGYKEMWEQAQQGIADEQYKLISNTPDSAYGMYLSSLRPDVDSDGDGVPDSFSEARLAQRKVAVEAEPGLEGLNFDTARAWRGQRIARIAVETGQLPSEFKAEMETFSLGVTQYRALPSSARSVIGEYAENIDQILIDPNSEEATERSNRNAELLAENPELAKYVTYLTEFDQMREVYLSARKNGNEGAIFQGEELAYLERATFIAENPEIFHGTGGRVTPNQLSRSSVHLAALDLIHAADTTSLDRLEITHTPSKEDLGVVFIARGANYSAVSGWATRLASMSRAGTLQQRKDAIEASIRKHWTLEGGVWIKKSLATQRLRYTVNEDTDRGVAKNANLMSPTFQEFITSVNYGLKWGNAKEFILEKYPELRGETLILEPYNAGGIEGQVPTQYRIVSERGSAVIGTPIDMNSALELWALDSDEIRTAQEKDSELENYWEGQKGADKEEVIRGLNSAMNRDSLPGPEMFKEYYDYLPPEEQAYWLDFLGPEQIKKMGLIK